MNIHEYQGKQIFARYGIPISQGIAAFTVDEAEAAAKKIIADTGSEVCVVKAQIHAGGRGLGGGVKVVKGADQLTLYKRTEASHRQFCKQCGSPVLVEHPTLGMIDVPAFRVEGLDFEPVSHVNYSEKVISMKDGVPKFKGFGGPGEELPE